jgi:KDO2-lipid IV(A) lauroyltransferase
MYLIGDGFYLLVYYVIGYRKKVVFQNLLMAFPEKTEKERIRIAKDFYHNLIDTFLEAIKLISISEKELKRRLDTDYHLLNNYMDKGRSVQIMLGHFFNWEVGNLAFSTSMKYPFVVVYMPIKNKTLEKIFYRMRSKFGTRLLKATRFKEEFTPYVGKQYSLILVGDQNPGDPFKSYWTKFFGQKTPFVKGPEKGARLYDNTVFFCSIHKVKRGYYRADIKLFTEDPRSLPEGEITREMAAFIEDNVRRHPANYLWSHRRWKHAWKPEYAGLLISQPSSSQVGNASPSV